MHEDSRKPEQILEVPVDPSAVHAEVIIPEGDERHAELKERAYHAYIAARDALGLYDTDVAEKASNPETIGDIVPRQLAQWFDPHPGAPPLPRPHRDEIAKVLQVEPEALWPAGDYEAA